MMDKFLYPIRKRTTFEIKLNKYPVGTEFRKTLTVKVLLFVDTNFRGSIKGI